MIIPLYSTNGAISDSTLLGNLLTINILEKIMKIYPKDAKMRLKMAARWANLQNSLSFTVSFRHPIKVFSYSDREALVSLPAEKSLSECYLD